jgi:predicted helicase
MYARFFRWASDRLSENGVLAFITNRSFIESRTFDGFRKTVAQEFSEIHVVDLGGDVRANPKLSGTKHNVFGIQTGVAISFMVKRARGSKDKKPARVFYVRRPEMERRMKISSPTTRHAVDFMVQPDKATTGLTCQQRSTRWY